MPPIDRHLQHLSQILVERVPNQAAQQPNQARLNDFFTSVAFKHVRIDTQDWRGRPVRTLLWHLPNLKPAGRTAICAFIVDRWNAYSDCPPASPTEADTTDESQERKNPVAVTGIETGNPAMNAKATRQEPLFTSATAPRRDWFDRFTDWVAAVVSPFSQ
jgi:hypothetical protein